MSAGKKHSEAEDAACGSALLASPLVSAIALLIAAELSTFALLRVAFHAAFRGDAAGAKASEIARAFGLGLRFDLRLALLLAAPLFVLGALAPLHPRRRAGALVWRGWILVAGLAVLLVYAFDFGHYEYLHERLDAAAAKLGIDMNLISGQAGHA